VCHFSKTESKTWIIKNLAKIGGAGGGEDIIRSNTDE
jgi:hypothetical protein